ncbi:MAG: TRAP transporter TatT component family protein [Acidobacteriota bacterium]
MKLKSIMGVCLLILAGLPLLAQSGEDLCAKGDQLFNEMQEMAQAQEALAFYQEAVDLVSDKYDVFWRMSRVMYQIGSHTEAKKEKKQIFDQGVYFAQKAVELQPEKPEGHYWLAVNYGSQGETRGVLKSLSLVKPIKAALQKVIDLDRSFEDGGADRVMGRVYFKLPGFAGGSKDKSIEHLEKSLEYGPDDPVSLLYYAETLLSMKEKDKARVQLERILALPDDPCWANTVNETKVTAGELMEKEFN